MLRLVFMVGILMFLVLLGVGSFAGLAGEPEHHAAVSIRPYLVIDGHQADPAAVRLEITPSRIAATLTAPRDATYRFGVALTAPEIGPLAAGMPSHTAASLAEPVTLPYPYDWKWIGREVVSDSRPRLLMPGVQAGGRVYLVDTRELWSLVIQPAAGSQLRALLLAHRVFNVGGDTASLELPLKAREKARFNVLVFDNLAAANSARSGQHQPLRGRMTQVPHRGWTAIDLTEDQHKRIAAAFARVFDYVILREVAIRDWVPPLYHQHGIKVFNYQYLGALRRHSAQVSDAMEHQIGLKDSLGGLYTAPTSPDGAWLLGDIRRPEVRARFVGNARAAVAAGFDGVFLDGYPFWTDAAGRCGGVAPGASRSLALARWELLRQMRAAIRDEDPNAILGVLGNEYFEFLGEADFVLRERMYSVWGRMTPEFEKRGTAIRQDLSEALEEAEWPFIAGTVACGAKGYSPISVQSCLRFLRRPSGLFYLEMGDFLPRSLDSWLAAMTAIARQDDLYITQVVPRSSWIHFDGTSTLWSDEPCTIRFSRPMCAITGEDEHEHRVTSLKLAPNERYRLVEATHEDRGARIGRSR